MSQRFNQYLLLSIVAVTVVVGLRLMPVAISDHNWRGFFYSMVQIFAVGIGTYYSIREK